MIRNKTRRGRPTFGAIAGVVLSCVTLATASEEAQDLKTRINSKDYSTAKTAVAEAAQQRNVKLVCEGLMHPSLQIRLFAVGEIQNLNNGDAVGPLLDALRANQAKYTGGSETEGLQNELNGKIVSTLRQLTKLPLKEKDILRNINDVEAWTKTNAPSQDATHKNQPSKNK